LYPRSVPIPIDEASISLLFHKVHVMVWCIIPGLNEGRVLLNYRIFQTSWVAPPKHANPIRLTFLKTPNAKIEKTYRLRIRARYVIVVKSYCILFSNIKFQKCLWTPRFRETEPVVPGTKFSATETPAELASCVCVLCQPRLHARGLRNGPDRFRYR
jgi:hypothetical protein